MKKKSTLMKMERMKLREWQMEYRIGLNSLKRTKEKIKEIAKRMREIQALNIK